ncbi:myosin heavy chain, clone 203-like [Sitodiplosis mosellana]|uniref:myosin heavy chain, clone 203-like n=1 Tax=Sitodiplosis mosellana TaxID=263140 RepID=UPI0024448667|nr:myosin heavy chain, clone 203-like [Sitodiplosis mosellana]
MKQLQVRGRLSGSVIVTLTSIQLGNYLSRLYVSVIICTKIEVNSEHFRRFQMSIMESESCAVVMPSRTLMLTGVPAELNNSNELHKYFSKFGPLLWVNERYDSDMDVAVITFFSIADAIAAFMSSEPVLDIHSIQKTWFEYTKKCDVCPYKYSSEESIKQHMELQHPSDGKFCSDYDQFAAGKSYELSNSKQHNGDGRNGNEYAGSTRSEINRQFESDYEHTKISTKQDLFRKDHQRTSNEMTSLKRKNNHLNDALSWTIKQRDLERSELGSLSKQLECIQIEKESVEEFLPEKCKQLGENEVMLEQISSNYEIVKRDKRYVDNEYSTLKLKNEDLSGSLNRALEQRNLAQSEALTLNTQLEAMINEKNSVEEMLRAKCNQLEEHEIELARLTMSNDLLRSEKEQLDNELNAMKDLVNEKERMDCEISSLKLKIEDLNAELRQIKMERDSVESEQLKLLVAENKKLVHDFKDECKRLEEKDQDFKCVSMKYDLLLKEKDRLVAKLNGKKELQENKKRLANEIALLKQENQQLKDSLHQMEKEKSEKESKIDTFAEKFSLCKREYKDLQDEKNKVVDTLKDECKRLGEKDLDFKRISANHALSEYSS